MSSSAAVRQPVADLAVDDLSPAPFVYPQAELSSGGAGSAVEAGQAAEERNRRQQADIFEQGRRAAEQQLRSELDAALAKHRAEIGQALQEFSVEKQSYYRRVEGEVVDLALAIARKILHRETQVDAHVLAGIVRVTLEKLESGTKVNLHVHPQEAPEWRHYFACQMEGVPAPDVHEDPALARGECRIETSLGATEVGLESQLKEIETGLADLLAERPGGSGSALPARTANSAAPQP